MSQMYGGLLALCDELDRRKLTDEDQFVASLLKAHGLSQRDRFAISREATDLVGAVRKLSRNSGVAERFLKEFSLDSREGLALMCLAEALLRTPDAETRDRLIAEKIGAADWASHLGQSGDLFVNASTWGLMLTGKLVKVDPEMSHDAGGFLRRMTARVGEPVIRRAVTAALGIMGGQFVIGRSIDEALARAEREGMLCSFDMLGESARTDADAAHYVELYAAAIAAVARSSGGKGPELGHGISVKLSALAPRFEALQEAHVWQTLYPRLKTLAQSAADSNLNFTIDAEEADRTALSLKLLARLAHELKDTRWTGLGFVVQAYQKRAPAVIVLLQEIARHTGQRLMVRLVKGAYWDSEIKRAQQAGLADYPVFTTKAATDVSYLACARLLLNARPQLSAQFATHNAHTLASVRHMAGEDAASVEHQRLHGMGEALYGAASERYGSVKVRAYAPVGEHEDLLPYLVRRLLENGANSSFVHRLLDEDVAAGDIVADPIAALEWHPRRHAKIQLPRHIYGADRLNAIGRDVSQKETRMSALRSIAALKRSKLLACPIVAGRESSGSEEVVRSPAETSTILGSVISAQSADLEAAVIAARKSQPRWDRAGGKARGKILRCMGDMLEHEADRLAGLLTLEAGKVLADAIAEVREAIDFCRYYALLAEREFETPTLLQGPVGETNHWQLFGRGVFACISPWNFPLAIFTGQIAAALAAGNAVLAKPAEQTPLIASEAVKLFYAAGLDVDLLALLPGEGGKVGAEIISHPGIDGVAFTGGVETAWHINRALAARPGPIIPLIAETGGLNAMFADTTALRDQVIDDALVSAFGSAGQRCSALRLLFVPEETADDLLEGLCGAVQHLKVGNPVDPTVDIGPVIDAKAKTRLDEHLASLAKDARIVAQIDVGEIENQGHFFGPVVAEIPRPDFIQREIFGPILHVYRYRREELPALASKLAATRYGLTLGIHSRLESFAQTVQSLVPAGNIYVNRSMTGAVVGAQPFGGVGLSGTGPKAGGPLSLHRFANERTVTVNIMAQGGDPSLLGI